jgi:UDP-2-acetamido-2,6-beta-L-arabino-hexul-4-ose reductase
MRVLVTGSKGFIGQNLVTRLSELADYEVLCFGRDDSIDTLNRLVDLADAVVHLAGVNRPIDVSEFELGNADLTAHVCAAIQATGRTIPLILASSTQAESSNPYGLSKLGAEQAVQNLAQATHNPCIIYRLPNVFGKWCKPNYNSAVATFCHNIANDLPIQVNDASVVLNLVYVDDVVAQFICDINGLAGGLQQGVVAPCYQIGLGDLVVQIEAFKNCRTSLISEPVGTGLVRALYATYVSYLPPAKFVYDLPSHGDERGVFVELLKTQNSGQFSFFTAHAGITRGGHYHHTKTEKFLVIKGKARFGFRHVVTGEYYEVRTSGDLPQVVETVPGWTHDITNIGQDEMIVMLWANEIFDRQNPDTIAMKVNP